MILSGLQRVLWASESVGGRPLAFASSTARLTAKFAHRGTSSTTLPALAWAPSDLYRYQIISSTSYGLPMLHNKMNHLRNPHF